MPRLSRTKSFTSLKSTKTLSILRRTTTLRIQRKMRKPKPPSRLMLLPPELRNEIYIHALHLSTPDTRIELRRLTLPPLLYTSRQILTEAASIYFAENHFVWTIMFNQRQQIQDLVINPHLPQIAKSRPIHDMNLDIWMPWVTRWNARGTPDEHRIPLAHLRKSPSETQWVWATGSVSRNVAIMPPQWIAARGPMLEEVVNNILWPVWYFFKLRFDPEERPPRVGVWARLKRKVLKGLDDQDRSWGRW